MNGRLRCVGYVAAFSVVLIAACSPQDAEPEAAAETGSDALRIQAVNYPLAYFAERIGGGDAEVVLPVTPGEDPAFWGPSPEDVEAFQQADLILLNGAGYAKWVDRVSLPADRLVDTSAAFRDRFIVIEGSLTHSHGPDGEHSHGETAFTTWLDPTLAIEQARQVGDAMVRERSDLAGVFEERTGALVQDWHGLDTALAKVLSEHADSPLLGSHPVYQYLARRYSLNMRSVHFEPDEVPDEAAWAELESLLAGHAARWMLWEGEPLPEVRARLEELGIGSVVFDPCGNRPEQGDLLSVMQTNVENLRHAFDPS